MIRSIKRKRSERSTRISWFGFLLLIFAIPSTAQGYPSSMVAECANRTGESSTIIIEYEGVRDIPLGAKIQAFDTENLCGGELLYLGPNDPNKRPGQVGTAFPVWQENEVKGDSLGFSDGDPIRLKAFTPGGLAYDLLYVYDRGLLAGDPDIVPGPATFSAGNVYPIRSIAPATGQATATIDVLDEAVSVRPGEAYKLRLRITADAAASNEQLRTVVVRLATDGLDVEGVSAAVDPEAAAPEMDLHIDDGQTAVGLTGMDAGGIDLTVSATGTGTVEVVQFEAVGTDGAVAQTTIGVAVATVSPFLLGDADGDGSVGSSDGYAAFLAVSSVQSVDPGRADHADVAPYPEGDGTISILDYDLLATVINEGQWPDGSQVE